MLDYDPRNWFWIVGADMSRYFSSAAAAYVTTLPPDAGVTRIASETELWAVLRDQFPSGLPLAQQSVLKSTVMARVIAANKMAQAQSTLWANPDQFARWFAPDQPLVNCTDPDTVAFITSLGLDPTVILAP